MKVFYQFWFSLIPKFLLFSFFLLQFEFIQLQDKIDCIKYKNDKNLDHVFAALLIGYYGESYEFLKSLPVLTAL